MSQGKKGSKYKARGSRPTGRPAGTKKMPSDPNEYSPSAHRTRNQAKAQSKNRSTKEKSDISAHQKIINDKKKSGTPIKPGHEVSMKKPASKGGKVTKGNTTVKSRLANRRQGTRRG